ncbi:MAG: hypothetical protein JRD94_06525 [Deltaproteobacteria bacterium]|nr:hypothetical protein [Deltaproteobacteria bacterium]
MLSLHILKKGQRLAEGAQRVLYTRFAIRFGRCVFRFEKRPNGLRDVLGFECLAERFASLSRLASR